MSQPTAIAGQEWSFGGEIGATLFSLFEYTPVYQEGGSFERGYTIPHNEGWILDYHPKDKQYFFSLGYTAFNTKNSDVLVRSESGTMLSQIDLGTFNKTISINMGYKLDIGHPIGFKSQQMFFEPLYGIGLEWLQKYTQIDWPGPLILLDYNYDTGINPSLQAGFRLSYRHRRSRFSVKALGNLGLRYHAETQYRVVLPEEPILANIRSKNDFLAAQASYEYIFKSNKVEKKTRKRDRINIFSRTKIQELKLGIHPIGFTRNISLNYELFPVKLKFSNFV